MKVVMAICLMLFFSSFAIASNIDSLSLLKRELGDNIEVHSEGEIRYCPDNTCEIFKTKKPTLDLASFVYLYLYHISEYVYLNESIDGLNAFRKNTLEESKIKKSMLNYCVNEKKSVECVLNGMKQTLGISLCFGRYDEETFCYGCSENENICSKF